MIPTLTSLTCDILDGTPRRSTHLLAILLILNTHHLLPLLQHLGNLCLFENLDPIRVTLGQVLKLLHQRIRNGHTGELGTAAVRALLRVPAEARDLGQVEAEALDEPVDGVARLVGEDFDEVVSGQFACGFLGVGKAAYQYASSFGTEWGRRADERSAADGYGKQGMAGNVQFGR